MNLSKLSTAIPLGALILSLAGTALADSVRLKRGDTGVMDLQVVTEPMA